MSDTHPTTLYVQTRDRSGNIRRLLLDGGIVRIGSAEDCDLTLDGLARNHLRIFHDAKVVKIVDLGGKDGTRLQSRPLTPFVPTIWPEQQTIQAGTYRFLLVREVIAPQPALTVPAAPVSTELRQEKQELEVIAVPADLSIYPDREAEVELFISNRTGRRQECIVTISSPGALGNVLERNAVGRLVPIDDTTSGGDKPVRVLFRFKAEKAPENTAGQYPVTITVESRTQPGLKARPLVCTWSIEPYYERPERIDAIGFARRFRRSSYNPERRRGVREATWRLSIDNPANTTTFYRLSARYDTRSLTCTHPDLLVVEPGGKRLFELTARALENVVEDTRHELSVRAQPTGLSAEVIDSPLLEFTQVPARTEFASIWPLLAAIALVTLILLVARLNMNTPQTPTVSTQPTLDSVQQTATAHAFETEVNQQKTTIYAAIYATQATTATLQADSTASARAIAQALQATQVQALGPALATATELVNERATQAVAAQIAQTVTQQVGAVFQTADAARQAGIAAVYQTATSVAGQTATADAGKMIVAQAQQQQTLIAGQSTQLAMAVGQATQQAEPASVSIGPVPSCVRINQVLGTIVVTVRDGGGRIADTATTTVTVSLEPADGVSSGRLRGRTQRLPDKGIARFFDLRINAAGRYRLLARIRRFEPVEKMIQVIGPGQACTANSSESAPIAPVSNEALPELAPAPVSEPEQLTETPTQQPAVAETPTPSAETPTP